ncbi:hypothetical protein [Microvirga brassicacearum]|uniref:Uncharacterized protein n=1 Tax=Microvirga brassicacearum TaxID=2580413 RepID=A0A5N3P5B9_9HYPH|nr:hypothetical protein [Microvirga brassicacearum]KAB0264922.1 hypothetical protein FEZ63_20970 [Microvirga brassicacearum]
MPLLAADIIGTAAEARRFLLADCRPHRAGVDPAAGAIYRDAGGRKDASQPINHLLQNGQIGFSLSLCGELPLRFGLHFTPGRFDARLFLEQALNPLLEFRADLLALDGAFLLNLGDVLWVDWRSAASCEIPSG